MPRWKFVANRALSAVENRILGTRLSELHTGYCAYNRKFLQTVPFLRNGNDFVFDTQVVAQAVAFGFQIAEVPGSTRYFDDASSTNLPQSTWYGLKTLRTVLHYAAHRHHLLRSRLFQP
jgi:hypothetical protein